MCPATITCPTSARKAQVKQQMMHLHGNNVLRKGFRNGGILIDWAVPRNRMLCSFGFSWVITANNDFGNTVSYYVPQPSFSSTKPCIPWWLFCFVNRMSGLAVKRTNVTSALSVRA
jgi:hypothetical protein